MLLFTFTVVAKKFVIPCPLPIEYTNETQLNVTSHMILGATEEPKIDPHDHSEDRGEQVCQAELAKLNSKVSTGLILENNQEIIVTRPEHMFHVKVILSAIADCTVDTVGINELFLSERVCGTDHVFCIYVPRLHASHLSRTKKVGGDFATVTYNIQQQSRSIE